MSTYLWEDIHQRKTGVSDEEAREFVEKATAFWEEILDLLEERVKQRNEDLRQAQESRRRKKLK